MVSVLLTAMDTQRKPTLDASCQFGQTALHRAAWGGSAVVVKSVLQWINPNIADRHGNTALHIAAEKGYKLLVAYLIDDGRVDVDSEN